MRNLAIIRNFVKQSLSDYQNYTCVLIIDFEDDTIDFSEREITISLNDFNYLGTFNKGKKGILSRHDFQLLISFVTESSIYLENILNQIKSGFRAGPSMIDSSENYDLTIVHNSEDYKDQLKQFEYYLNNLNIIT